KLMAEIFKQSSPVPVAYEFINRIGQTKKMSKSAGDVIAASEVLAVLPPEVVRFFVLRYNPDKQLFFDESNGVTRLVDEFAEFIAKPHKTEADEQLLYISTRGLPSATVSSLPFSHVVESY